MTFDMSELEPAPPQTWGDVQLVPLLRKTPVTGLRLDARAVGATQKVRALDTGRIIGYVPHAFIATWDAAGPTVSYGTQLLKPGHPVVTARPLDQLVRRLRGDEHHRLRFLPLVLALDGLLGVQFAGPPIIWPELSKQVVRRGLSPRVEASIRGEDIPSLDSALRTFEILDHQCGVLVYVAGQLLSAVLLPHPHDYRIVHDSLLLDLYGDVMREIPLTGTTGMQHSPFHLPDVATLEELRTAFDTARQTWVGLTDQWLTVDLWGGPLTLTPVYRMGGFKLFRFLPQLNRGHSHHLGEAILDQAGRVAYLHTYRMSMSQVRRARLVLALQQTDWQLDATCAVMGTDRAGLIAQLHAVGLDTILRADIVAAWRRYRS